MCIMSMSLCLQIMRTPTFAGSHSLPGFITCHEISTSLFSFGQCDIHSHNREQIEANCTVLSQVPHHLHSLYPLCHSGLSQRKADLWRGRGREKEKSFDKQKIRNG